MSLVGPRPEVPQYVELFRRDYEHVLSVRPGITDLASIVFRDEAGILARAGDPQQAYVARILPKKLRLARHYIDHRSLWLDIRIVLGTLRALTH
jgi:lipopolysaccharide/colanic/teichoic acid biosynthesis glycosyltransferase